MWGTEGWRTVTIATDSTYVVEGITDWVARWKSQQWTKMTGEDVANVDLWKRLLRLLNKQAERGCEVRFWHIAREHNVQADELARKGAENRRRDAYKVCDLTRAEASRRAL